MDRLLLSVWPVGTPYTGRSPILLQTTQNSPASAEQLVLVPGVASLEPMNVSNPENSGLPRCGLARLTSRQRPAEH